MYVLHMFVCTNTFINMYVCICTHIYVCTHTELHVHIQNSQIMNFYQDSIVENLGNIIHKMLTKLNLLFVLKSVRKSGKSDFMQQD